MVHEEDSSSQRDKVSISGLKNCKGNKIKISFTDGSFLKVPGDIILQDNIYEGKELTYSECEEIKFHSEMLEAEKSAITLLSFSQHSKRNLSIKLTKRGFSDQCIDSLLQKLEECGYINDREFALTWVTSRMIRHPEGKSALMAGLFKQGISRETAGEVVKELLNGGKELEMAVELCKKLKELGKTDEKIAPVLRNRGFSYRIVQKVLGMEWDGDE